MNLAHGLREAHDLIARRGLARGRFYDEEAGTLDIGGALYFALPYRQDRDSARVLIRAAIRELHPSHLGPKNFDLYLWSDDATEEDVLAALLQAALIAERVPA